MASCPCWPQPSCHTQRMCHEPHIHGSRTQLHTTSSQRGGKAEGRKTLPGGPRETLPLVPTPVEVSSEVAGKLKEKQKQRILGKEHWILLLQKMLSTLKGSAYIKNEQVKCNMKTQIKSQQLLFTFSFFSYTAVVIYSSSVSRVTSNIFPLSTVWPGPLPLF